VGGAGGASARAARGRGAPVPEQKFAGRPCAAARRRGSPAPARATRGRQWLALTDRRWQMTGGASRPNRRSSRRQTASARRKSELLRAPPARWPPLPPSNDATAVSQHCVRACVPGPARSKCGAQRGGTTHSAAVRRTQPLSERAYIKRIRCAPRTAALAVAAASGAASAMTDAGAALQLRAADACASLMRVRTLHHPQDEELLVVRRQHRVPRDEAESGGGAQRCGQEHHCRRHGPRPWFSVEGPPCPTSPRKCAC